MRDKTLKRMLELADIKPIIKESKQTLLSSMEIVKKSVDGNTYAIVRENKKYFIKSTKTKENLKESDFDYIGGIQNKTKKSFNSFSDVTKHLNLMFEEINNHSNVDNVNILESDLLNEKKYILKLKKPKTEPAPTPAPVEDEFDAEGEEGGDEFDFDAEGEGGEELDVELDDDLEGSSIKDIQSTTGVLGQQIRDTEDISSDMQKWVAKSVLSALDLDNMDVKDKQDIINTVKSADKEIEVGTETTDEFSFEDEIEEGSDELGLNVSKTTEPDVQTWETPPNSESGYGDQKRMPWESNNRGYDEDNPDIGGDEDERIAEPGKSGEDMLILDVIDDDSYDIPNAEAEALYGPNTYPEYSREPSYRAKKQADKDIRTHYYKSAPPGFETDPSDEWRKHKLPYDTKFLDEDDDTWYNEMEEAGILAPNTYEEELGLPPATNESINEERAYLGFGEFIDRMDTIEQEHAYEDIEDMVSPYGYTIGWSHKEKLPDEETFIFLDVKDGSKNIFKVRINSIGDMEIGQMEGKKFVGEPLDSFSDFDEVLNEKQIDEDMETYDDITMAPQPQRAPKEDPAQPQVDPGTPEKEPPSKRPSRKPFTPPPYIDPGDEPGPKAGDKTVAPPKPKSNGFPNPRV